MINHAATKYAASNVASKDAVVQSKKWSVAVKGRMSAFINPL